MSGLGPKIPALSAVELKARLDGGGPIALLDVREHDERAHCAIPLPPTARDLHIPLGEVSGRLDDVREAAGADPLVVYCHHGVRSARAAHWLAGQGVREVYNLSGGIDAWSESVDPGVPRY